MPRQRRLRNPLDDPGYARVLERLIADQRDTTLPTDAELDAAATINPSDADAAERLWDEAQRAAGTGLEGLLDAREERRNG